MSQGLSLSQLDFLSPPELSSPVAIWDLITAGIFNLKPRTSHQATDQWLQSWRVWKGWDDTSGLVESSRWWVSFQFEPPLHWLLVCSALSYDPLASDPLPSQPVLRLIIIMIPYIIIPGQTGNLHCPPFLSPLFSHSYHHITAVFTLEGLLY